MRAEKQLLLDDIRDQIEQRPSFVIVGYEGLNAQMTTDFRRQVNQTGGEFEVVRKRILLKAAESAGIELEIDKLPGHIGIVFSGEDPVETTKTVVRLRAESENAVRLLGGRIDGELYEAVDVEKLSTLPGKDEMRAQLISTFIAPMQQTVSVMDSVLCSVLHCLEGKSKKESN